MNDGVIERYEENGDYHRIRLRLNYYGLAQALIKSGLVPDEFKVEYAAVDDDHDSILEISVIRETRMESAPP